MRILKNNTCVCLHVSVGCQNVVIIVYFYVAKEVVVSCVVINVNYVAADKGFLYTMLNYPLSPGLRL